MLSLGLPLGAWNLKTLGCRSENPDLCWAASPVVTGESKSFCSRLTGVTLGQSARSRTGCGPAGAGGGLTLGVRVWVEHVCVHVPSSQDCLSLSSIAAVGLILLDLQRPPGHRVSFLLVIETEQGAPSCPATDQVCSGLLPAS